MMKGISRIDQPEKHNHGWYARVSFQGRRQSKWFSDRKYGDPESALDAAKHWVERTHQDLGKPLTNRRVVSVALSSTKIVGVSRDGKSGGFLVAWSPRPGVVRREYVTSRKGLAAARKLRTRLAQKMYAEGQ